MNILVATNQYVFGLGLQTLLNNEGFQNVLLSIDLDQLYSQLEYEKIDVLLIDYHKICDFTLSQFSVIKIKFPDLQMLAISDFTNKEDIIQAIDNGVLSFLTKDCDQVEIIDAVRATARGQKFFCNKVLDFVLEGQINPQFQNCKPSILSTREIEIITLMGEGLKAKEIAETLELSIHTIYTHQKNIMRKWQVSSSTEVVLHAINEGLISIEKS